MNSEMQGGFEYLIEVLKDGVVIDSEVVRNVMPLQGANHILGVALAGASQVSSWYVGLYEGNYVPSGSETAALLPSTATECTAYSSATRAAWTPGSVANGTVNNSASKAEFTFTASKTVYGGFITSAPAKGATTGVLTSVVRFSSPRTLDTDSVLRVTAGFTLTSV
jgi:hypothetical protein